VTPDALTITGGASGIGRELAEELSKRWARAVVLVDRRAFLAEKASGLRNNGTEAKVYEGNVRDFAEVQRAVNETVETYGHLVPVSSTMLEYWSVLLSRRSE
jgi:NAD(P)-dependent dehydrogenase (short-subunit alcohol dehydrogenase family)